MLVKSSFYQKSKDRDVFEYLLYNRPLVEALVVDGATDYCKRVICSSEPKEIQSEKKLNKESVNSDYF